MTLARIDTGETDNTSTICHISSEELLFNILMLLYKLANVITQEDVLYISHSVQVICSVLLKWTIAGKACWRTAQVLPDFLDIIVKSNVTSIVKVKVENC